MSDALIVFIAMFALDFVWAFYAKAIQAHQALGAALWATVLIVFSGLAQIGYVANPWLLIPAAAGAFAGTYGAMKWSSGSSSMLLFAAAVALRVRTITARLLTASRSFSVPRKFRMPASSDQLSGKDNRKALLWLLVLCGIGLTVFAAGLALRPDPTKAANTVVNYG